MRRLAVLAFAAIAVVALLAAAAAAHSDSSQRLRGTMAAKDTASNVVTLRTARSAVGLRVPGTLASIRVGQRAELRGSTLRSRGNGSRVLARNVTIVSSTPLASPAAPKRDDDEIDDDEVELTGTIASLAPLRVVSGTRSVTCGVPVGFTLSGFAVGDLVEITCDLVGGTLVLRELHHEDRDDDDRVGRDDDDDRSGPGGGDDADDDDDDDDDDNSGPGGGDDD